MKEITRSLTLTGDDLIKLAENDMITVKVSPALDINFTIRTSGKEIQKFVRWLDNWNAGGV